MGFLFPFALFSGLAYLGYRGFRRLVDQTMRNPQRPGGAQSGRGGPIHEIEARACAVCRAFVADGAACNRPDCPRH